jgi:hypothetical protein
MVRGKPEHGLERGVPVEAPIVSEDKLVEIRVDVLAAQPMAARFRTKTIPAVLQLISTGQCETGPASPLMVD